MKSEFGKLKGIDFLNALYHALVALVFPAIGYLQGGKLPTQSDFLVMLSFSLSAFFGDLVKRNYTNSDGKAFRKEN